MRNRIKEMIIKNQPLNVLQLHRPIHHRVTQQPGRSSTIALNVQGGTRAERGSIWQPLLISRPTNYRKVFTTFVSKETLNNEQPIMLQNNMLKAYYSNCLQVYQPFASKVIELSKKCWIAVKWEEYILESKIASISFKSEDFAWAILLICILFV